MQVHSKRLASLILAIVMGSSSLAAADVFWTMTAPLRKGTIRFNLADLNRKRPDPGGDVRLDIPSGLTAAETATLIELAIISACDDYFVFTTGGTITISLLEAGGFECMVLFKDTTGENNLVITTYDDDDGTSTVINRKVILGSAGGGPTGGGLKLELDGESHTVPTAGQTIPQILEALRDAFGFGTVSGNALVLPPIVVQPLGQTQYGFQAFDPGVVPTFVQSRITAASALSNTYKALVVLGIMGMMGIVSRARV